MRPYACKQGWWSGGAASWRLFGRGRARGLGRGGGVFRGNKAQHLACFDLVREWNIGDDADAQDWVDQVKSLGEPAHCNLRISVPRNARPVAGENGWFSDRASQTCGWRWIPGSLSMARSRVGSGSSNPSGSSFQLQSGLWYCSMSRFPSDRSRMHPCSRSCG